MYGKMYGGKTPYNELEDNTYLLQIREANTVWEIKTFGMVFTILAGYRPKTVATVLSQVKKDFKMYGGKTPYNGLEDNTYLLLPEMHLNVDFLPSVRRMNDDEEEWGQGGA